MNNKPIRFLIICTLFTVIGLVGGFMAASQKSGSGDAHGDHEAEGEDHSGHDHGDEHGHEESPLLSAQALKNLNVEVQELDLSSYTTYRPVAARIEATPKTVQPILAPIGGTVQEINVEHGELVKKGIVLVTLMRDSIPRPELKITGSLLDPEQRLKGLSVEEISNVESKLSGEKQAYIWKNSLKRFGYWTSDAEKVLSSLPKRIQSLPFSVAVIGEISANGYLEEEFVRWIQVDKSAPNRFFEISSYVLEGKSLSLVKNMVKLGAFDSLVTIKVPDLADDFDVHALEIKPGDHVEMGQKLGELHNLRELHIEAHARGSEVPLIMNALKKNMTISAVPLTKDSGSILKDLKIRNILDDGEKNGATVHLEISKNESFINKDSSGRQFRSWDVRAGTRYIIRVPQKKFDEVFVLPSNAVVEDGPEKVVFIQDGDAYNPAKVVVLYQNDEVAILSQDSDIFPGDPVVTHGAFGLGLALKAQTGGAVDPHAGHNH